MKMAREDGCFDIYNKMDYMHLYPTIFVEMLKNVDRN